MKPTFISFHKPMSPLLGDVLPFFLSFWIDDPPAIIPLVCIGYFFLFKIPTVAPSTIPSASSSSNGEDDHNDAKIHDQYIPLALDEAVKCTPAPTVFCVGCVIVLPQSQFQSIKDEWPPRDAEMNSAIMSRTTTTTEPNTASANSDFIVASDDNTEAGYGGGIILSTGYSRELPGNTHAEANALAKLRALSPGAISALLSGIAISFSTLFSEAENAKDDATTAVEALLRYADVYTTLEPCSVRTSGLGPCADALIAARVRRCFIGVGEPDDFVQCEGARKMQEAGVEIVWLRGWQEECLAAARRGH